MSDPLDENFNPKTPTSLVRAFDAFPKTKPSYTQQTSSGGKWTIFLLLASFTLACTELRRWWGGETTHEFSVEAGVGHDLQINLDVVVRMQCRDLHVNVQDASGDRILAGQALKREGTSWKQWGAGAGTFRGGREELAEYREEDVHDYLGAAGGGARFRKTPRVPRGHEVDSCRVFGSLHGNKVQGDFHITARGHGYMEFGQHLGHEAFNFSHHINELSFGPFYPSLTNPLDNTRALTDNHFHKFQYYLSVVPTIYTTDRRSLARTLARYPNLESPSSGSDGLSVHPQRRSRNTVFTNQYAVNEQSHSVPENSVPGVFVKFDIEPIQLVIAEEWRGILGLGVRLVNVVSGVLVAGGWCFQLWEWAGEVWGRRRRRAGSVGVLGAGMGEKG
ncbi:hypothetical protein B0A50_05343 [Salinomyces thailandicus]|uniref:Endoplasmic reticulum-Golgi intermediate compartment protein n=1 Tax=Salinomyces thailandicus TaxID=706561 RepID=A0A4U0TWY7_9PEZI|nr:hypothetical protein B0A50_05343 [Salinomyces thailandica]